MQQLGVIMGLISSFGSIALSVIGGISMGIMHGYIVCRDFSLANSSYKV